MAEDPRIVTRPERNAATSFRDNASGPPDEAPARAGRPNDLGSATPKPALANSTMKERRAAAEKRQKQLRSEDEVEDKQVARKTRK